MIEIDKPNPFRVLELSADATNQEIVERGQELIDLAETEAQRRQYRWAMEQLITKPLTRLQYELYEFPDSEYKDDDWERFVRINKRNPINIHELAKEIPAPGIEDFDLSELIQLLIEGMLRIDRPDIQTALQNSPFKPGVGPAPLEVKNVIFG